MTITTVTIPVRMLTGYGAGAAPCLTRLAVHRDHIRSALYWGARPLTLRRNAGRFNHPLCNTSTGEGETFMLFRKICSPVLQRNRWRFERVFFRKNCFPDIQPRETAKVRLLRKKLTSPDIQPREGTELNHPGGFLRKTKTAPAKAAEAVEVSVVLCYYLFLCGSGRVSV